MVLHNLALTPVNGMTVRQFIATCDKLMSGDTIAGLSLLDATTLAAEVNGSFLFGPSAWAQSHLRPPG